MHGIEIELAPTARPPTGDVDGDSGRDVEVLRIAARGAAQRAPPRRRASGHRPPRRREDTLAVEVQDDGVGFDPEDPELRSRHLGLTSMEERARELGGTLELRSAPGAGTTVRLEVPRRER